MQSIERSQLKALSILERSFPPGNGVGVAKQRDEHISRKTVFHLTIEADDEGVIEAICAALPKGSRLYLQSALDRIPIEMDREHMAAARMTDITARQRDILALLVEGLSNKEIGRRLCLSHFTVRNHIHHIMRGMNLSNRKDVAAMVRATALQTVNDRADHTPA